MYATITRDHAGQVTVYGPAPDMITVPDGHASAVTVSLSSPTWDDPTKLWPHLITVTAATAHTITNTASAPEHTSPVALLLIARRSRSLLAVGPFETAAQARTWRGGPDRDLAGSGVACALLPLTAPPQSTTGGEQ